MHRWRRSVRSPLATGGYGGKILVVRLTLNGATIPGVVNELDCIMLSSPLHALPANSKVHRIFKNLPALLAVFLCFFPLLTGKAETDRPDLASIWKTVEVSPDDPNWRVVDLACRFNCPTVRYKYLDALLRDPANDDRSLVELYDQSQEYFLNYLTDRLLTAEAKHQQETYDPANAPALDCSPDRDGLRHQITAPLPIQIEQTADKVMVRYEYWNAVRTIYTDGSADSADAEQSRLGHSVGRYEGSSLVAETSNMIPMDFNFPGGHITVSGDAIVTERFTLSDDGNRLDLEWVVDDPENFREPYSGLVAYLRAPDWELEEFTCDAISGEY